MRFERSISVRLVAISLYGLTIANNVGAQNPIQKLESPVSFSEVVKILRPREVEVEIQGLIAPAAINEIAAKMREGASKNRAWFMDAIKRSPGPIPYDARMGITEAEYKRFKESDKEVRIGPIGKGRLRFELAEDSKKITIVNMKDVPQLDGMIIDIEKKQVQTKWATLIEQEHTRNDEVNSPTGPWHAFGWKFEGGSVDAADFKTLRLSVGKHKNSKRSVIYLRVAVMRPNGENERADAFLLFN